MLILKTVMHVRFLRVAEKVEVWGRNTGSKRAKIGASCVRYCRHQTLRRTTPINSTHRDFSPISLTKTATWTAQTKYQWRSWDAFNYSDAVCCKARPLLASVDLVRPSKTKASRRKVGFDRFSVDVPGCLGNELAIIAQ